jgi:uncharacterized membrane protein YbhN (UPF0104 family)
VTTAHLGPESHDRHLASHIFNLTILVVGGTALALMMRKIGWDNARDVIVGVGAWFPVIVALDIAAMAFDAAAIHQFMRPEARMVAYWRVFAAQASGRAINILTPGGALGETTKVTMLVTHAPRDRVISSIVLFNLAAFYLAVAVILIGVPITLLLVDMPHQLAVTVWIAIAVLLVLVVGLAVLIHRGALGTVIDAIAGLRIIGRERATAWKLKLVEVDRHLSELHSDQSPGTRAGLAFVVTSRLVQWIATTTLLHAVGVHLSFTVFVGVMSVGVLIGWVAAIVPLGIGVADGGNYALYSVLGATGASGVFVTLLNRMRSLPLACFGLSIMGLGHAVNRVSLARRRHRLLALRHDHPAV